MLTKLAAAAVATVVATACGSAQSVGERADFPPASSAPPPASPTVSPRPVPAGATVYYTASATLTSKERGSLSIRVKRQDTPDGRTVTTVTYERSKPCHEEGAGDGNYFVSCPVSWRKTQKLARDAQFTVDPALSSAELSDTLHGERVTVRWTANGQPYVEANQHGNLFFESRDAVAESKWGTWSYVDPAGGPPRLLARRVPKPSR